MLTTKNGFKKIMESFVKQKNLFKYSRLSWNVIDV
jgi:hypothetical protein